MIDNAFKRNDMVFLFYCFVQNTTNSHLRVLRKIKEKIGSHKKDAYYAILSKLLLYENDDLAPEIFDFYLRDAT
jgi:mannitol/fructose-specific phosphotransferase system IIA component (Ntr-type)